MKKGGILHPGLLRVLAEMGHTDLLTVCDRGFPVPVGPARLDLALVDDIPTVPDVLRAIEGEFVIDSLIVAEEMKEASPDRYRKLCEMFSGILIRTVSHVRFKDICRESRAVVRTGDTVPYANVIVVSG